MTTLHAADSLCTRQHRPAARSAFIPNSSPVTMPAKKKTAKKAKPAPKIEIAYINGSPVLVEKVTPRKTMVPYTDSLNPDGSFTRVSEDGHNARHWPQVGIALDLKYGRVMTIEGSLLHQQRAYYAGLNPPPLPSRKRGYLKETDPEKRAELAGKEEIESRKMACEILTDADRQRIFLGLPEASAIKQVVWLLSEYHKGSFKDQNWKEALELDSPNLAKQLVCGQVGELIADHFGDDFALLRNPEEIHRKNAAKRLKSAFGAVFDHFARGGQALPPSKPKAALFVDGKPRELIMIEHTGAFVKEHLRLPYKAEIKSLCGFKRPQSKHELSGSSWTELFKNAGLENLPDAPPHSQG